MEAMSLIVIEKEGGLIRKSPPPPPPSAEELRREKRYEARIKAQMEASSEAPALRAAALLNYAKKLLSRGKTSEAKERLKEIVKEYRYSGPGIEAKELLEKLKP
jgi:hypothetical protein